MDHEKMKELLAAGLYGDNSPEDSRSVNLHLETCAECRTLQSQWQKAGAHVPALQLPQDDAFWIRQRSAIMEKLPKQSLLGWNWHRLAGPVAAFGVLVSVWGLHERQERTNFRIAQNIEVLQDMDMLQQLDVVEVLDVMEKR